MNGVERIAAERQRQIDEEGYSPEHDLEHGNGALAFAAACYASPSPIYRVGVRQDYDQTGEIRGEFTYGSPWPEGWARKSKGRLGDLVKAGALIAAEIDRLLAQEAS